MLEGGALQLLFRSFLRGHSGCKRLAYAITVIRMHFVEMPQLPLDDEVRHPTHRGRDVRTQAAFLTRVEQIEQRDVERLEALTKLAQLRGVSVRTLMQQLGLRSGANE